MWKSWINSHPLSASWRLMNRIRLNKELADTIGKLRQMEEQDLEELNIDELQKLEDETDGGLSRVLQTKDERIMSQILALETKGAGLIQAKNQLQQRVDTVLLRLFCM